MAEPRPTDAPPLAPAHGGAAQHVAGAPEAPGEKPGGTTVERWMLVGIVLTMVALPTLEAVVRKTGDVARHFGLGVTWSGVPGAASYTEHLTLWVGFLGALLATATGHHLALSTVDLLPAGWPRNLARSFGAARGWRASLPRADSLVTHSTG